MHWSKIFFVFLLGGIIGRSSQELQIQRGSYRGSSSGTIILSNLVETGSLDSGYSIEKTYDKMVVINDILKTHYANEEKLNLEKMSENALRGFVNALDDPYTIYLDHEENSSFEKDLKGQQDFEGIGAVIEKKDDGVVIQEIVKGSPSFKEGLKPLDLIIEINGEKIQNLSLNDAVQKIRGPKGSEVELTVYRKQEKKVWKQKITRDTIIIPSVKAEMVSLKNGKEIAVIELSIFGEDTERLFEEAIKNMKNADGVILDLRGNGGGILPIAVMIASHFIPAGQAIVGSRYSTYPEETYNSKGFGTFEKKPVIVLVNGLSASASEILAGALREQREATLIGTKTFGKGSIQTVFTIDDGSSLKYTIGKRYTPKGTNIDKEGLEPDIKLEFDTKLFETKGIDNQLERAKTELGKILQR